MNQPFETVSDIDSVFFFDTETHLGGPGAKIPQIVCLQYATNDAEPHLLSAVYDADDVERILDVALDSDNVVMSAHNAAFDMAVIAHNYPHLAKKVFAKYRKGLVSCTLLREKLIRIATGEMSSDPSAGAKKQSSFSLAKVLLRRFDIDVLSSKVRARLEDGTSDPESDPWRLRYAELEELPVVEWPEEARSYALDDVTHARDIWMAQAEDPTGPSADMVPGLMQSWAVVDEAAQARKAFAFHLLECWGNVTDPEAVQALVERCSREVEAAEEVLKKVGFMKGHCPSRGKNAGVMSWSKDMGAIKDAIQSILGEYTPRTEKGAVSTDNETKALVISRVRAALGLEGDSHEEEYRVLLEKDPELAPVAGIQALLDSNDAADTMVKWAEVLREGVYSSIHPHYNSLVETGRTSCFKPNMQNPKRKGGVRECFVARDGYTFIFADYATLELRALAQTCYELFGYSRMLDMLKQGRDLHLAFCAVLNDKSYEETVEAFKAKEVWAVEGRQLAKAFNFGVPGGLGWKTFVDYARAGYNVTLAPTEEEAEKRFKYLKNQVYYVLFPEMRDYHEYIGKLAAGPGGNVQALVQMPTGRIRGEVPYCAACNSLFQGRAADGAKEALWRICEEAYTDENSPLYGARPCLFLHDEIAIEMPNGPLAGRDLRRHLAAKRMEQIMCEAMQTYIPDCPIEAAPTMMFRWHKGADPVFDADGNLVPCEPQEVVKDGKKKKIWVRAPERDA